MYVRKKSGDTATDLKQFADQSNTEKHQRRMNEDLNCDVVPKSIRQKQMRHDYDESSSVDKYVNTEKSAAIELHENRSKREDFKHYEPTMRYSKVKSDSPEGRRSIHNLQGLEKENVRPEDRKAREEQYN